MGQVIRTDQAEDDLVEILDYLQERNPAAAARFEDEFERKFRLLSDFPMMGRAREELAPSLRSSLVAPYVVYYRPLDDGIVVVRVIHASRDVIRLFGSRALRRRIKARRARGRPFAAASRPSTSGSGRTARRP